MRENLYALSKWSLIAHVAIVGTWAKIPHTVQILIALMGIDILSGVISAAATKSLNSSIMVKGLFKKLAVFPLLALLHIVETPLALPFEFESMAALAFIAYEAMSIVENCATAGVPIPAVVVGALAKAKIKTASVEDIRREFSEETVQVAVTKTNTTPAGVKVEKQETTTVSTKTEVPTTDKPAA